MKSKFALILLTGLALCQSGFADSNSKPMTHDITPYAGPHVTSSVNLYFTVDFLWWKAKQSGLTYATSGVLTEPTQPFQPLRDGKVGRVAYDWDPGFKVGAGYKFWHDNWDLYAEYTWLHTDGSDSKSRTNGLTANFNLPNNFFTQEVFNSASSRSHLMFNSIDLGLGRNFYLSPNLMTRPHIGFKGTWQQQDWRSRLFSSFIQIANANVTGPYRVHHHSRYYGVGVRAGIDTAWHFTSRWSLFGDLAATAMWSHYKLRRHDTIDDTTSGQKQKAIDVHSSFFDLKYIGEFQIGLRFQTWLADNSYHLQFQAGWEEQIWINHMTYIDPLSPAPFFDLSLHGLTVTCRFDF